MFKPSKSVLEPRIEASGNTHEETVWYSVMKALLRYAEGRNSELSAGDGRLMLETGNSTSRGCNAWSAEDGVVAQVAIIRHATVTVVERLTANSAVIRWRDPTAVIMPTSFGIAAVATRRCLRSERARYSTRRYCISPSSEKEPTFELLRHDPRGFDRQRDRALIRWHR